AVPVGPARAWRNSPREKPAPGSLWDLPRSAAAPVQSPCDRPRAHPPGGTESDRTCRPGSPSSASLCHQSSTLAADSRRSLHSAAHKSMPPPGCRTTHTTVARYSIVSAHLVLLHIALVKDRLRRGSSILDNSPAPI